MSHDLVSIISHRALGSLVRLTVAEGYSFDLTFEEARTLSRALAAVRGKKSSVDEIYMSPIASDGDFSAKVEADGLLIEAITPSIRLGWPKVGEMADALAAAVQ